MLIRELTNNVQINIQEGGYINNTKDAIETLGRLRGKGKQLERGQQEYEGNLPNGTTITTEIIKN